MKTKNGFCDKIKYKKIGNLTLPCMFRYTLTQGTDQIEYYVTIEDFNTDSAGFDDKVF